VVGAASSGTDVQKKTFRAAEQDRPGVSRRRLNFTIAQRFVDPRSLVFLDESGAKTNMTRLYGRSLRGDRVYDAVPHGHWGTTTMLSAIRLDGVIQSASLIYQGSTDAAVFTTYVEQCLAPHLKPGDIVVLDNLSSHKVKGVTEAIEADGADVWYLPPYSPDFNPIEKMWSKVKAILRSIKARDFRTLIDAIATALRKVTSSDLMGYFASCGYQCNQI
jgi:transposase